MARPKTKLELQDQSQQNYQKLMTFVKAFSAAEQQQDFPAGTLNRNVRDVLAHLHHWHILFLEWYKVGMSGKKPSMPAEGYTWKTTPELNQKIWQKYQNLALSEVQVLLQQSFEDVQTIINVHSNEELFEKRRYKWTGTTSLGAYLVSATSSHYAWAYKLIKKVKKH